MIDEPTCTHDWASFSGMENRLERFRVCRKCDVVEKDVPVEKFISGTPLVWMGEFPRWPGWYWWREDDIDSSPMIVRIKKDGSIEKLESEWMNEISGEWAGPLEPPV